jgi:alcohol dehydrogenase (NADP+)
MGYRHIDTASLYGNEEKIGKVISELIAEGVVTRAQIFLTTKI